MNTSDRIQHLRKTNGISQEELADRIGVSRQAVSKWENEQSSPDLENIVLMSEIFDVTTDYLLKGIEPVKNIEAKKREKPNAIIFTIAATAFNALGLILSVLLWLKNQTPVETAIGLAMMVMGCMIFAVGLAISDEKSKEKSKKFFWAINIWILIFIPLSLIHNISTLLFSFAPIPILLWTANT